MRGHFGKKFSQPCGPLLFYGGGGGGGGVGGGGGWRWLFGKAWSLGHYPRNKVVEIDLAVPFFPAYSFISICGIIIASMVVSRGIL